MLSFNILSLSANDTPPQHHPDEGQGEQSATALHLLLCIRITQYP
jgi:hypothetical protein